MHDTHDLDLVSALADGSATDPTAARRLVAECSHCAEVYHDHRAVLDAITNDAFQPMTDLERHRLHASLWAEVTSGTVSRTEAETPDAVAAATPSTPSRGSGRTPWWYRVAPVAAALVVVVGIAVPLANQGNDGDMAASDVATLDAAQESESAEMAPADGADDATDAGAASPDTAAPDGTVAESMVAADQPESLTSDDLPSFADEFATRSEKWEGPPADGALNCVSADVDANGEPTRTEMVLVDETPAWVVALGQDDGTVQVRIYSDADCALLFPTG